MSKTPFAKGNQFLRDGDIESAIDYYCESIGTGKNFYPVFFNLSFAIKKSDLNGESVNRVLEKLKRDKEEFDKSYKLIKSSKLVNAKWYLEEYSSWMPKGVDPILHYMLLGWRIGLNPCKRFNTDYYISKYKDQCLSHEVPLLHYIKKGAYEGNHAKPNENENKLLSTAALSAQLWGGHSTAALKEFKKRYTQKGLSGSTRYWAMWHTARWLYFCGEIEQALVFGRKMRQLETASKSRKETVYLTYFCLLMLGRHAEAHAEIKPFIERHPKDADAQFALANALDDDNQRIEAINQAYGIHGFTGIDRKDKTKPLSIGNIIGLPAPQVNGSKKVSIIMPIYSAGDQVRIAIDSLLAQTYENIEIIAVDDCSPDDTFDILKAFEKQDSRLKAVQPPQNGGAYAARNYGLRFATGDLFTTHDSDDWSHPQKIATQVAHLEKHPDVKGCSVHWIRAQENLEFTHNWRPNNYLTHWSQSSFMLRKEVLDAIGEWDHVRIGGDTEYIWRMQATFGRDSLAKIHSDTPLAFALDEEGSLTRTKATHVRTVYFGLRHIYREICAWWHKTNKDLNIENAKAKRVFPAPRSMFERGEDPLEFDAVIAGDFSRLEDCKKAADYIYRHSRQKLALFHWPSFQKAPESLCDLYFEQLQQDKVEPIVVGQNVNCNIYAITDKGLEKNELDDYPGMVGLKKWLELI